jgi:hypothetical protein
MPILLKNNTETEDVRLDRVIQFDERSRNYGTSEINVKRKPRSYSWKCNEWFDQGREGACVAYALSHELAARPCEIKGISDKWMVENVYWEAQKIDPWEGGVYPGANPRYEGTSVLAGVSILHKKGFFDEYRWAFGIDELIMALGYNGPAVLGVRWYEGMFSPDSNGYINPTGKITGGHAIMAYGVNLKKEHIILRNSWGKSWGMNGDCFLSFADTESLLKQQGEAVFLIGRKEISINMTTTTTNTTGDSQ